jgi:hypothetical protein
MNNVMEDTHLPLASTRRTTSVVTHEHEAMSDARAACGVTDDKADRESEITRLCETGRGTRLWMGRGTRLDETSRETHPQTGRDTRQRKTGREPRQHETGRVNDFPRLHSERVFCLVPHPGIVIVQWQLRT